MSASGIETTELCVQNLHMHTFLVAGKIQKVGTDPSQENSLSAPVGHRRCILSRLDKCGCGAWAIS